ncbi:hypothetical protein A5881_001287 [Enterococcus termitis]
MQDFKKNMRGFFEDWEIPLTIVISILGVATSFFISVQSYKQVSLDRVNQVSIDLKDNRTFSGTENVEYDVTVHNGSDLTIYNITIISPEDIIEMQNGSISIDQDNRFRGVYLGDIAPNSSVTRSFLLKNSQDAQLEDFKMEFMSVRNSPWSSWIPFFDGEKKIWWEKEVGSTPKKLSEQESQFKERIKSVHTIKENK